MGDINDPFEFNATITHSGTFDNHDVVNIQVNPDGSITADGPFMVADKGDIEVEDITVPNKDGVFVYSNDVNFNNTSFSNHIDNAKGLTIESIDHMIDLIKQDFNPVSDFSTPPPVPTWIFDSIPQGQGMTIASQCGTAFLSDFMSNVSLSHKDNRPMKKKATSQINKRKEKQKAQKQARKIARKHK